MAPNLSLENRVKFRKLVLKVKKMFPAAYPVRIKTIKKHKKKFGYIKFVDCKNPFFQIFITQSEYHIMVDTFLHEWSHALNWKLIHNEQENPEFHDEGWAVEYSKLYRLFIDPGLENPNVSS